MYLTTALLPEASASPDAVLGALCWGDGGSRLAVGGGGGSLRVLSLGGPLGSAAAPAITSTAALSAHRCAVVAVAWGGSQGRLATADSGGLVVVWSREEGAWVEELAHQRDGGGCAVVGLQWRPDGEALAVAYADGGALVACAGRTLWASADVAAGAGVSACCWSPDGGLLLLGCGGSGGVPLRVRAVAGATGEPPATGKEGVPLQAELLAGLPPGAPSSVVALAWHAHAGLEGDGRVLAVALCNGRVQLSSGAGACSGALPPLLIDTGLTLRAATWRGDGGLLALAGRRAHTGEVELQLYSPSACCMALLRTSICLPVQAALGLAWDPADARLAVAAGPGLYFAAVRTPCGAWAVVGEDAAVVAARNVSGVDAAALFVRAHAGGPEASTVKFVRRLVGLHGAVGGGAQHCVLVCAPAAEAGSGGSSSMQGGGGSSESPHVSSSGDSGHKLLLCDAEGILLDSRTLPGMLPDYLAVTATHVLVASAGRGLLWAWALTAASEVLGGASAVAHVACDPPAESCHFLALDRGPPAALAAEGPRISCMAARGSSVLVGFDDGVVCAYTLVAGAAASTPPQLVPSARLQLRCPPLQLHLNSDGSRFAAIGADGCASLLVIGSGSAPHAASPSHVAPCGGGAWGALWADDAPALCACSVREQVLIVDACGGVPTCALPCLGAHLARFHDLAVTLAQVEELRQCAASATQAAAPPQPVRGLLSVDLPIVSALRLQLQEAPREGTPLARAVSDTCRRLSHPRLWRMVAEAALVRLCLPAAERAYIALCDVAGLRFVRRLAELPDDDARAAEVLALAGRVDDADAAHCAGGRLDRAVELRVRMGHWHRVLELVEGDAGEGEAGPGGAVAGPGSAAGTAAVAAAAAAAAATPPFDSSDMDATNAALSRLMHTRAGDYWADRLGWQRAISHYAAGGALAALVDCYSRVEDYAALTALSAALPLGDATLIDIGDRLAAVGLASEAAAAFVRGGDARAAVAVAAALQRWTLATELGAAHGLEALVDDLAQGATMRGGAGGAFKGGA